MYHTRAILKQEPTVFQYAPQSSNVTRSTDLLLRRIDIDLLLAIHDSGPTLGACERAEPATGRADRVDSHIPCYSA